MVVDLLCSSLLIGSGGVGGGVGELNVRCWWWFDVRCSPADKQSTVVFFHVGISSAIDKNYWAVRTTTVQ